MGFFGSSVVKNPPAMKETWVRKIPGEGNGNPLQYSCLKNPMGKGAWWATVPGVARVRHYLVTKPPLSGSNLGSTNDLISWSSTSYE